MGDYVAIKTFPHLPTKMKWDMADVLKADIELSDNEFAKRYGIKMPRKSSVLPMGIFGLIQNNRAKKRIDTNKHNLKKMREDLMIDAVFDEMQKEKQNQNQEVTAADYVDLIEKVAAMSDEEDEDFTQHVMALNSLNKDGKIMTDKKLNRLKKQRNIRKKIDDRGVVKNTLLNAAVAVPSAMAGSALAARAMKVPLKYTLPAAGASAAGSTIGAIPAYYINRSRLNKLNKKIKEQELLRERDKETYSNQLKQFGSAFKPTTITYF